jgi:hypothetical protein
MSKSIEERQIELQENRLELERDKLKKDQEGTHKPVKKIDPITATIIVALIGFIGTTIGTVWNNRNVAELESRKFEFDLIKKGLEQPNAEERLKYLQFLSKLKLISNNDMNNALNDMASNPEEIPYISSVSEIQYKPVGTEPIEINKDALTETNIRLGALKAARREVGTLEDKSFGNGGPAVHKYMLGGQGVGWNTGFVSWCYSQNAKGKSPFKYCYGGAELKAELEKNGWYKASPYRPQPGDIYILQRGSNSYSFHVGIVDSVQADVIKGIEGNVSAQAGVMANGVFFKTRKISDIIGYGHVD